MGRLDDALRKLRDNSPQGAQPTATYNPDPFTAAWDTTPRLQAVPDPIVRDTTVREPIGRERPLPVEPVVVKPHADKDTGHLLETEATPFRSFDPAWRERLVLAENSHPMLTEQFRALAASLHRLQADGGAKVLMLTSAEPGEGKTLTALNLALVFSESYRRKVLLIDADLRRPSIREISGLSDQPGLSEGLKSKADKKLQVVQLTNTLTLLPAGAPDPDPMSGLTSARMRRIIEEAAARFEWVILDAPPLGPVADASLLAAMVDAALLVVRAGRTSYVQVEKAIDALGRDKILGVVLNGVEPSEASPYDSAYGAYRPATRAEGQTA